MPQPLSRVAPGATPIMHLAGGANPIHLRPKLAVFAMAAIQSWTKVEHALTELYIGLAGGAGSPTVAAFFALKGDAPKNAAINALAELHMAPEHLRVFNRIKRIAKSNQSDRDKLVHHVWATTPALPDAFLLVDPKDQLLNCGEDKIFVWRKSDFERVASENERLCGFLFKWRLCVARHFDATIPSDGLFRALCAELGLPEMDLPDSPSRSPRAKPFR